MLHGSLTRLKSEPGSAVLPGWVIEAPLVIPTTPIRRISDSVPSTSTEAIRALSALAISRRNLVQLFTLLSFVLLIHLTWSLRKEVILAKASGRTPSSPNALQTETESDARATPTYWLRRGELRRNLSVIGFSFLVTGFSVIFKIVTAYVGHGVWSG